MVSNRTDRCSMCLISCINSSRERTGKRGNGTKTTVAKTSLPPCTEKKTEVEIESGQYICRKYARGENQNKRV